MGETQARWTLGKRVASDKSGGDQAGAGHGPMARAPSGYAQREVPTSRPGRVADSSHQICPGGSHVPCAGTLASRPAPQQQRAAMSAPWSGRSSPPPLPTAGRVMGVPCCCACSWCGSPGRLAIRRAFLCMHVLSDLEPSTLSSPPAFHRGSGSVLPLTKKTPCWTICFTQASATDVVSRVGVLPAQTASPLATRPGGARSV